MSEDRRRTGQHESRRDDTLRRWIADEVHPYAEPVRALLDASGLGRTGVRTAADLSRLPVTELAALGDGRRWVLDPRADRIRAGGTLELRMRLMGADVLGRRDDFVRRHIDAPYKPVRWTAAPTPDGVLLTSATSTDLDQLAVLGRRALAVSGVVLSDRLVCTEPPGAGVGPLQLELGAREAGVAHLAVDIEADPRVVHVADPTVLTGTPATLHRALDAGLPDCVRLLIVHLGPAGGGAGLGGLARRAGRPVRLWWSPPGVRAAWATCEAEQLHTWPDHEHLETVDAEGRPAGEGRLVWSAVGWRGSVWLRVALGPVGRVDRTPCTCGRTTPRVLPPAPANGHRRDAARAARPEPRR